MVKAIVKTVVKETVVEYQGWCMRCKKMQVMKDTVLQKMKKTGAPAVRGVCVKCGCKMFKILPKNKK